jgi:hypothetical protein
MIKVLIKINDANADEKSLLESILVILSLEFKKKTKNWNVELFFVGCYY